MIDMIAHRSMPLRWNADYPLVRPMSQTNVSIAPSFYPGNELAVGLDLEEAKEIKSVCAAQSTCSVADVRFLTGGSKVVRNTIQKLSQLLAR